MDKQMHIARPVRSTVIGFLSLTTIAVAITLARATGLIEVALEQRVLGLVIGAMIAVTGNFLPKMRPLNTARGNRARATAAERLAGWVLLLAGIVYLALFAFAQLDQARRVSSIIGIGAILVIAADWAWLARSVLSSAGKQLEDAPELSRSAMQTRKLAASLLIAFFFVLAVACVTFLFGDTPWGHQIGSWSIVAFSSIYALLYGFLGDKHVCK